MRKRPPALWTIAPKRSSNQTHTVSAAALRNTQKGFSALSAYSNAINTHKSAFNERTVILSAHSVGAKDLNLSIFSTVMARVLCAASHTHLNFPRGSHSSSFYR